MFLSHTGHKTQDNKMRKLRVSFYQKVIKKYTRGKKGLRHFKYAEMPRLEQELKKVTRIKNKKKTKQEKKQEEMIKIVGNGNKKRFSRFTEERIA